MVSQTVEYALRAMSHLASHTANPATSQVISQATRVPHGYLSKIMRDLVCANLVKSYRGRNGGFVLARDPTSITVLDIVSAVDPIRRIETCPIHNHSHIRLCPLHQCLDDALASMQQTFRNTTLGTVQKQSGQPDPCNRIMKSPNPSKGLLP